MRYCVADSWPDPYVTGVLLCCDLHDSSQHLKPWNFTKLWETFTVYKKILSNSGRRSRLSARACHPTAGFTSTCIRRKWSSASLLEVFCGQHVECGLVGFLDRNYCYKSAANQTPYDARLARVCWLKNPPPGIESAPYPFVRVQSSTF